MVDGWRPSRSAISPIGRRASVRRKRGRRASRSSWREVRAKSASEAQSPAKVRDSHFAIEPTNRTAKRGFLRRQTEDWDGFVAFTAHHVHATAVDVFGAIDRVLAHPGRYGFTNVTTADHEHAATTALYDDD